jgi:Domain of unknown function (DUF4384)
MISVLLLPLLSVGNPAVGTAAVKDDPPIQLWISNDRRFLPGERAKVQVRTEADGYLLVLHVDPDGYLRVLFPLDPDKDSFVRGGKKYEVRGRGDRQAFEADGKGRGTVYAAVSKEPYRFDNFVIGDHWDYRAMAPSRLSSNPEPELNELVRRMALGDFDYDILSYDVVERAAYASDYYHYNSVHYDPWCYRCGRYLYGSPFGVSIVFGRPYRRYYYDPYYYAYDPFYNPFFYDPYYYRAAYYPRYVYPHRYYYGWDGSYYDRYPYYNHPYTPYRFRSGDDFRGGYRDRRYDLRRAVNTVYHPPIAADREPAIATPTRRVIGAPETPGADLPNGLAPRRVIGDAPRIQGRPAEARRARPDERGRERSVSEPRLIRREVEAKPSREAQPSRNTERRPEPRAERGREAPRATAPAPRREAPSKGEARGGGGSPDGGGARPSNEGSRRRR